MLSKSEFLDKYHVDKELERSGMEWELLEKIGVDHENHKPELTIIASKLEKFLKGEAIKREAPVHSIRSRVKDPEHLVEKICRKSGGLQIKKYMDISVENYRDIIHDLIGIRILTVSKEEWESVHDMLVDLFPKEAPDSKPYMAELPIAYVRYGDRDVFKDKIHTENTHLGYRSQHYIVMFEGVYCEIQVRTLAEEAFGEFDHRVKYPYRQNNRFLKRYSSSVSQLLDSVDELISSCLTMGEKGWKMNEEYFDDTEYYDGHYVNLARQKVEPIDISSELLVDENNIDAYAYAERFFQRRG